MTPNPKPAEKPPATSNPVEAGLAVAGLLGAGGWLGYRYIARHSGVLTALDTATALTLAISTTITVIATAHLWWATHPQTASETEPDTWRLRFPARSATTATAAAVFTTAFAAIKYQLQAPLIPALGLAIAAALATTALAIDRYRLRARRTEIRSTLIQALYHPLGYPQPTPRVVPATRWQPKSATPQVLTIRALRPTLIDSGSSTRASHLDLEDTTGPASRRPDATTTIRKALRAYCDAQYHVSPDPSGMRFTATYFVPEQLDEDLADLSKKVREVFESTASVSGDPTNGFTVKHTIGKKLIGEFRKRIAEQTLTELIGGNWRVEWKTQVSEAVFTPKPELDRIIYPTPVPAVRSIAEAVGQYRHTRFAYGVDLDLGIQEWDPLDSPHTLVGGKTGAGKTVYLRTLIMMAALRGWAVVLVDFKGGSFSDFVGWPNVHIISSDPYESIATIHRMYKLMDDRNARARWDQTQWEDNLPYLVIVDEAAQFKVVLNRLWNNGLKPKNGDKECPTLTEINEMARLSRTARVHLVMCMQRPDHDLIDTESRDNFGNRVSVGPISRIAAEMLFDDSYTGRFVPRIKGRGMSTGVHQDPRETQYFFTPPADSTKPEEAAVIEQLRPPTTLIPRYVPELPADIRTANWNDIANARWFPLAQRPDLDPTLVTRKITHFDGDSRFGFDLDDPERQPTDLHDVVIAADELEPKDIVSFDGRLGEVDGVDIGQDGTVTVMWQDEEDGRLCLSTLTASNRLTVQRSSS